MTKKITKHLCSLVIIIFALCVINSDSFAADHTHIFENNVCSCGTIYMENFEARKIRLEEKGQRLFEVTWKTSDNAPFVIENNGMDGFLTDATYYANIKGVREGEGMLYTYVNNNLVQTVKIYVDCRVHSYGEFVADNNGVCEDGTKSAQCKYCSEKSVVTDKGSAVHAVLTYTSNGDATCSADGTKTGICSLCGAEKTVRDENSKTDHNYQNFVSNGDATCLRDGTEKGICTMCGAQTTRVAENSALGHEFIFYASNSDATCTADGTKTATCSRCGVKDTKVDEGSALGHYYGAWTVITESTCKENGLEKSVCLRCNIEQSRVIETKGHNWVLRPAIEPTCKEEGRTSGMYCSKCNTTFIECKPVAKLEHVIGTSLDPATLTDNGFYMESCPNCDTVFSTGTIYRPKTVKLEKTSYIYDGKVKNPVVIVKDVNGKALKADKDYKVKYEGSRKDPDNYNVVVTFKGNYEGEKVLTYKICPNKTSKLTVEQTTDSITLTWKKVTGATGYRVYLYNKETGKYESLKTLKGTEYTVKKLKSGTTYKFAVKAYSKNEYEETIWADSYTKITTATKPDTLKVKSTAGSKKVSLSWSAVRGATGYQVYMQAPGGEFERIKVTDSTKYTVTGLKSGATYNFRVRAYKTVDGKNIYGGYKTFSVKVK